jgi:hypothetical protein
MMRMGLIVLQIAKRRGPVLVHVELDGFFEENEARELTDAHPSQILPADNLDASDPAEVLIAEHELLYLGLFVPLHIIQFVWFRFSAFEPGGRRGPARSGLSLARQSYRTINWHGKRLGYTL